MVGRSRILGRCVDPILGENGGPIMPLFPHGRPPLGSETSDRVRVRGGGNLDRDGHAELAARDRAGTLSANAASIQARYCRPRVSKGRRCTMHAYAKRGRDLYPTPEVAVLALLQQTVLKYLLFSRRSPRRP